jgi:hypothetical protein
MAARDAVDKELASVRQQLEKSQSEVRVVLRHYSHRTPPTVTPLKCCLCQRAWHA